MPDMSMTMQMYTYVLYKQSWKSPAYIWFWKTVVLVSIQKPEILKWLEQNFTGQKQPDLC